MTASPAMTTPRPLVRPTVLMFVIVGVAVLAYLPSLAGGWVYDDHPLIQHNPYVHDLSWWPRWLTHDFWNVDEELVQLGSRMIYWRPAISLSYAVDWKLSGGSPLWFHTVNLAAHGLVALLAFHVLMRWLRGRTFPAFLAALLFAVHPTKTESVAWIAGRTDVFCMIAVLLASTGMARRLAGARYGLALEVSGTALAYLCKEQALVLPAFVIIELWVALDEPALNVAFLRRALRAATPQILLAIAYVLVRSAFLPLRPPGVLPPAPFDHVLVVLETFGRFFTLTFAPHDLSIQQALVHTVHGKLQLSTSHILIGLIGLIAFGGIALASRRRFPAVALGIGFFLATLIPTANVVYTGMATLVSERFLYLPALGLAWAIGAIVARMPARADRYATAIVLLAVSVLCAIAMRRSADYADEDAFWRRELELHPASTVARDHFIAQAMENRHYYRGVQEVLGLQEALEQYDVPASTALELAQRVALVTSSLVPDLDVASLRSIDTFAADLLSGDLEEARMSAAGVTYAIKLNPEKHQHRIEPLRSRLLILRSRLAARQGDTNAAVALANEADQSCRQCTSVVVARAFAMGAAGNYDDALRVLATLAAHNEDPVAETTRTHLQDARNHRDKSLNSTGALAIKERAQELASLELWGAAYHVLEPHKDDFAHVREVALGFAELAFRAGAPDVAKQVLALHVPAAEIQPMLDDWAAKMGWRD